MVAGTNGAGANGRRDKTSPGRLVAGTESRRDKRSAEQKVARAKVRRDKRSSLCGFQDGFAELSF